MQIVLFILCLHTQTCSHMLCCTQTVCADPHGYWQMMNFTSCGPLWLWGCWKYKLALTGDSNRRLTCEHVQDKGFRLWTYSCDSRAAGWKSISLHMMIHSCFLNNSIQSLNETDTKWPLEVWISRLTPLNSISDTLWKEVYLLITESVLSLRCQLSNARYHKAEYCITTTVQIYPLQTCFKTQKYFAWNNNFCLMWVFHRKVNLPR